MIRAVLLSALAATLLASPIAAAPVPADFAFGKPLLLTGSKALYEFELPDEVYRQTTRNEVEDLAVFNAAGELVPFRIFFPPLAETPSHRAAVPFFPIPTMAPGTETLALLVQRGQRGEVLALHHTLPVRSATPVFLVDLSALQQMVQELEFFWQDSAEGVVGQVRVEESDDLHRWHLLHDSETVARVRFGGHLLEKQSVGLGRQSRPYLRLTFQGVPESFRLTGVRALFRPSPVDAPRRWLQLSGQKVKSNEFAFVLPGSLPIDRIRIKPPQPNTVARVALLSRAAENEPWSRRSAALIYHLTINGAALRNPAMKVDATGHRYWLMQVAEDGGGLGNGLPEVEMGWRPHQVRFVARGPAPFLLAYGSGRQDLASLQADDALLRLTSEQQQLPVGRAELGTEAVLSGPQALRPSLSPQDWKTVLLWAVLVASVAFLIWMAVSLYRRMECKEDGGQE